MEQRTGQRRSRYRSATFRLLGAVIALVLLDLIVHKIVTNISETCYRACAAANSCIGIVDGLGRLLGQPGRTTPVTQFKLSSQVLNG